MNNQDQKYEKTRQYLTEGARVPSKDIERHFRQFVVWLVGKYGRGALRDLCVFAQFEDETQRVVFEKHASRFFKMERKHKKIVNDDELKIIINGKHVGDIVKYWHPVNCYQVFLATITHGGRVYSNHCDSIEDSQIWANQKYKQLKGETFSGRLAKAIQKSKYTQTNLGEKIGVSQQTISMWCNGLAVPSITQLLGLCRWLYGMNALTRFLELAQVLENEVK